MRREDNATSCLLDIRTAGLPSWSRVASLLIGPSVPWRARSSNSSSAPPKRLRGGAGHVLGLLRANHFVNSHEQGVRTMGRAGRAHSEQLAPGSARTGGGHELVALVVRNTDEASKTPQIPCCLASGFITAVPVSRGIGYFLVAGSRHRGCGTDTCSKPAPGDLHLRRHAALPAARRVAAQDLL